MPNPAAASESELSIAMMGQGHHGGAGVAAAAALPLTLIHMGDLHGHLVARPNLRRDSSGFPEGGVANMYTLIAAIRRTRSNTLLINTGDTIQGSAEALFTRGQAIVDILNRFQIDAFAPGNWDFLYGTSRFLELFAGTAPLAPWSAVASNLYYDGEPFADRAGQRVLSPYVIKTVGSLRIGILGFTTDRGLPIVGGATKGFKFTKGDGELAALLPQLRDVEQVDLVVMISELGLANNIRLAEANPGIDVILSSDMHEVTVRPVVTSTGTIIVEEGQDGTRLCQLDLQVQNRDITAWQWRTYVVDSRTIPDAGIAAAVQNARASFVAGPAFTNHLNPINGTRLQRPIDSVVGYTRVPLQRANFSNDMLPAVVEGSSHDLLTDAFRAVAGADVGAIRGFRFGTHVRAGAIRLEDIYHFLPIGALIARGTVSGQALKNQIEALADGALNPDVSQWTGGWLGNYSGMTMNIDPYQNAGARSSNIQVTDWDTALVAPLDTNATYTYASHYYATAPNVINLLPAQNITILRDENGEPLDATEVVARYLQRQPNATVSPQVGRIQLLRPLPQPRFGNLEVQPLAGAGL
jgi:2',3'-cyclic-nucleotide 2'-phosphodiesterase (5'-nucleotidase family)